MLDLITSISFSVAVTALLAFCARHWFAERIKQSIQQEYAKELTEIKSKHNQDLETFKQSLSLKLIEKDKLDKIIKDLTIIEMHTRARVVYFNSETFDKEYDTTYDYKQLTKSLENIKSEYFTDLPEDVKTKVDRLITDSGIESLEKPEHHEDNYIKDCHHAEITFIINILEDKKKHLLETRHQ